MRLFFKNYGDYKQIAAQDPRKSFEENQVILNMLLDLLWASDNYEKIRNIHQRFEDMNKAIRILDELRRINVILGDKHAAEENKRWMFEKKIR